MRTGPIHGMVVAALCCACVWGGGDDSAGASWDDQLREMQYLIMHLSSINAINGLNLTKEQAAKLKRLAREVEAAGAARPSARGRFSPELGEVRDTYMEARKLILKNEAVPPEMERKVGAARAKECNVLRASLEAGTGGAGSCASCHAEVKASPQTKAGGALDGNGRYSSPKAKHAVAMAHIEGSLGRKGMVKVASISREVDAVLTDGQREIMAKFACCLVPPKGLSDPVRAGQAAASEESVKLLRRVREVPDSRWPATKEWVLALALKTEKLYSPGAAQSQTQATRDRVTALLDKVRAMPETEFEMNKDSLSAEWRSQKVEDLGEQTSRFKAAWFLTLPGSAEVYDEVIRRLDGKEETK